MFPRVSLFRSLFAVALTFGAVDPLCAQLASKSPFLPPQAAAAAGPTAGAPIEYRAYMSTSEGMLFRIYDPAKKAGTWVKLNERNSDLDVLVKQSDDSHATITVEHGGKTLTLAARESKVVSAGSAPAMPAPPVAAANVPAAVTQAVVLNPTPADEQRRLEAVAAEVARRRALREQATQNVNQSAQSQPQRTPQPVNRR